MQFFDFNDVRTYFKKRKGTLLFSILISAAAGIFYVFFIKQPQREFYIELLDQLGNLHYKEQSRIIGERINTSLAQRKFAEFFFDSYKNSLSESEKTASVFGYSKAQFVNLMRGNLKEVPLFLMTSYPQPNVFTLRVTTRGEDLNQRTIGKIIEAFNATLLKINIWFERTAKEDYNNFYAQAKRFTRSENFGQLDPVALHSKWLNIAKRIAELALANGLDVYTFPTANAVKQSDKDLMDLDELDLVRASVVNDMLKWENLVLKLYLKLVKKEDAAAVKEIVQIKADLWTLKTQFQFLTYLKSLEIRQTMAAFFFLGNEIALSLPTFVSGKDTFIHSDNLMANFFRLCEALSFAVFGLCLFFIGDMTYQAYMSKRKA